jgi:hypothetical protein
MSIIYKETYCGIDEEIANVKEKTRELELKWKNEKKTLKLKLEKSRSRLSRYVLKQKTQSCVLI